MKLSTCSESFDGLAYNTLKKVAAKQVLSSVKISKKMSWDEARPIIASKIEEAASHGPIDEKDILEMLVRLHNEGVKVADGTSKGMLKEAQFWRNFLGKATDMAGRAGQGAVNMAKDVYHGGEQFVKNMGDAAQSVGEGLSQGVSNIADKAQQGADWAGKKLDQGINAVKNAPANMQAAGKEMQLNSHKNDISSSVQSIQKSIGEIGKLNPELAKRLNQLLAVPIARVQGLFSPRKQPVANVPKGHASTVNTAVAPNVAPVG